MKMKVSRKLGLGCITCAHALRPPVTEAASVGLRRLILSRTGYCEGVLLVQAVKVAKACQLTFQDCSRGMHSCMVIPKKCTPRLRGLSIFS